ncbi:MAG: histidine kinase [Alistipes sp.]|nr:histidine kinase [Alistipes sp.]
MNTLRCTHIIHIFAALHAIIVALCQFLSVSDELLLTVATVSMIAIIGIRKGQGLGIVAASVIAGNILGFVIGTYGAQWLAGVLPPYALHPITSLVTTEIIGFGILLLYNSLGGGSSRNMWVPDMFSIVLTIGVLLIVRLVYSKIFGNMLSEEAVNLSIKLILSNSLAIIVLICCNIIYLMVSHHYNWLSTPVGYIVGIITESVAIAALTAVIIGYNLPFGTPTPYQQATFIQLFSITFIANLIVYVVMVMLSYVYQTRTRIEKEQEKRRLAQFQYNILKQQVNPHFLFNSLNILNGLIEEGKNDDACEYVRKLASLYRYMLQNEDEHLVRLSDELAFIEQYIDLLKVRFPNGFSVNVDIDERYNGRFVVQCSIQVLIENAFKHNIVRAEQPLNIDICTEGEEIVVRNNLQPKASSGDSTKVGLQNISKQYIAAIGKEITITKSDTIFEVKLPLI